MERYAWKAVLKEGQRKEYIRRHKQIWPEMKDVLKACRKVEPDCEIEF